jgi:hypothetical protein
MKNASMTVWQLWFFCHACLKGGVGCWMDWTVLPECLCAHMNERMCSFCSGTMGNCGVHASSCSFDSAYAVNPCSEQAVVMHRLSEQSS